MKEPLIHLGGVKVPLLDYAVSCNAILGIRDSGKTVTAKGIAEQLLERDIPIVVFDAVGKWRFMKVPGPGARGRGYKVVVAGGKAPDLALNAHSVGEIVRSAVKERIPLIIDLYDPNLSKADWRRIVQESIRIIHYEAVGVAHVFLEEAAEFIPQKPQDFNTYAEVEKLARMGGNASVGITIINQRAQEVNKAVLDLAVNLILGCQVGSKAIEWIGKWLDRLSPETAKAVTTSLPKLKSGEDWVWTRSNLDEPLREQMPMCRSLHPDRRTPEVALKSAKAINPEEFVDKLNAAIPKLVEEAKANDPVLLRKKIADLEKNKAPREQDTKRIQELTEQLAAEKAKEKPAGNPKVIEKRIMAVQAINRLEALLDKAAGIPAAVEEIRAAIREGNELNAQQMIVTAPSSPAARAFVPSALPKASAPSVGVSKLREATGARSIASSNGDGELTAPMVKILETVRMLNVRGLDAGRDSVARWLGIHPNGGRYGSNLATLRAEGYLEGFELTAKGLGSAGEPETGIEAARDALKEEPMRKIFDILLDRSEYSRDALAANLGIHPNGGRYGSNLAWMRTMGLLPDRGTIKLTEGAWK